MMPINTVVCPRFMIRFFEAVTGVSADEVLPGQTLSIRKLGQDTLDRALRLAGANGATGAEFEREFNLQARALLPEEALKLPTLPSQGFSLLNLPRFRGHLVKVDNTEIGGPDVSSKAT